MVPRASLLRVAGAAALLAGAAWIAWVVGAIITAGGIDRPAPLVSPALDWLGRLLMASWNLLLLPAALLLWRWLRPGRALLVDGATVCGLISLLMWALGGLTRSISIPYEVGYIALSALWWLGLGAALRERLRGLGRFTLALGLLAVFDAVVTLLGEAVPFVFWPLAGLKLPLSTIWDFWLGLALLRLAGGERPASAARAAAPAARGK